MSGFLLLYVGWLSGMLTAVAVLALDERRKGRKSA